MSDLTHVSAIVTGGGAGIGRVMVEALLEQGARVLCADVSEAALATLALANARHGERLASLQIDISQDGAGPSIVAASQAAFGRFNVLISNAGIGRGTYTRDLFDHPPRAWDVAPEIWERFFQINTLGAIRLINAAMPALLQGGWGRIVVVTTSLDSMLNAGTGPYGPSKAALEAFAAVIANETAGSPITTNVLVPGGPVDTAMIPQSEGLARGALLRPEVMTPPLLWLLTRAADSTNAARVRANLWDEGLEPAAAFAAASAPIAWASLAAGQRRDATRPDVAGPGA